MKKNTKIKKHLVIAPYANDCLAMYEYDELVFRSKFVDYLKDRKIFAFGSFKSTDEVKGLINGGEIGIFTSVLNERFIVFYDWSAVLDKGNGEYISRASAI